MEILKDIHIEVDIDSVCKRLHLKQEAQLDNVAHLLEIAQACLEPKAVYSVCYVEQRLEDAVVVDGRHLKSKVLRKNLEQVERIFPYVVTIGKKYDQLLGSCSDILEKFYLDTIGNVALHSTRKQLRNYLQSKYALAKMAFMSPGSLADWPVQEQRPLFGLLGDVETAIGVQLTKSLLMLPIKSVSGIYFPTEATFLSCQLCSRQRCESRKAKYDEQKAREYGIIT